MIPLPPVCTIYSKDGVFDGELWATGSIGSLHPSNVPVASLCICRLVKWGHLVRMISMALAIAASVAGPPSPLQFIVNLACLTFARTVRPLSIAPGSKTLGLPSLLRLLLKLKQREQK